ncbi:MAG: TraM recognition domain-containing protein, partial [Armatimonadota bacterium]
MGDRPNAEPVFTLVELPLAYLNEDFRQYLANRSQDPQLKDFVQELERTGGEASVNNLSPYITSKFNRFLHDKTLRAIVGHGEMRLNFGQVLDQGQVLIVKLGWGRFGSQTADILLGLLLSRFRSAVMARAEQPRADRRPFFLYVDEIGSLAQDENFSQLLAEARKYRVGLVLATQYACQLKGKDSRADTLAAVLGNVGTVAAFRLGVQDAEALAPIFAPRFQVQDLLELPNFQGY